MRLILLTLRGAVLLILLCLIAQVPAWGQGNVPQPPPQGYGVAIGYGLGGVRELDALGPVWYLDYRYDGAALRGHPRLLTVEARADLAAVPRIARQNPGAWWQFGNEPNNKHQDNLTPAEYADLYHHFYLTVKRADSAAMVSGAGIANADVQWAESFRENYRARFGRYPPIDGWSIHNYMLDDCQSTLDVEGFKARIRAFRDWMVQRGQGQKPLFLTEYGVLYGNGCCGCPALPAQAVTQYMQQTSTWLHDSHLVTAWAWFAVNTHNRYNGDLFEDGVNLTLYGQAYRELVKLGALK